MRVAFQERSAEADSFRAFLGTHGFETPASSAVNEGEGDFAVAGDVILAGHGFRSALTAVPAISPISQPRATFPCRRTCRNSSRAAASNA
jgi:N-dimethylarginine dimethylaminohydrolase